MQAGLRDDNRPVGMSAARLLAERAAPYAEPGPPPASRPARGATAPRTRQCPSRDRSPPLQALAYRETEAAGPRAARRRTLPFACRAQTLPRPRARVARESGDDRSLARPGLAQEPHDGRDRLCTLAGVLRVGARPGHVAEQNLADGLPEPIEKSHDFSFQRWIGGFEASQWRSPQARILRCANVGTEGQNASDRQTFQFTGAMNPAADWPRPHGASRRRFHLCTTTTLTGRASAGPRPWRLPRYCVPAAGIRAWRAGSGPAGAQRRCA